MAARDLNRAIARELERKTEVLLQALDKV